MMNKRQKLEAIFYANSTPEEKLLYEKKKLEKKIAVLQEMPPEYMQGPQGPKGEPGKNVPEITGDEIIKKVNDLESIPDKQISFEHIKNFPWHQVKQIGGGNDNVSWGGYGAYDLNIKAITLGQITADQNNYITGLGSWFRISSDAARNITGFEGGIDGRGFVLTNVGSFTITLSNESVLSSAAYRIITGTGADIALLAGDNVWFLYDVTSERWRVIERGSGSIASGTINEIAYFDTATTISSLAVATYPSLTELSYVKGVTSAIQTQLDAKEVPLTFSTGLTRTVNTITANLSTGVAGGQAVIGGTVASNNLTLQSTSHATKGSILFGTSVYNEVNNRLGIGITAPRADTEIRGTIAAITPLATAIDTTTEGTLILADDTGGTVGAVIGTVLNGASYDTYIQARNMGAGSTPYNLLLNPIGGNVGIGTDTPTAKLHLRAGTTAASTAPLKFNTGSLLTVAEAGAVEFLTDTFYGTITTGAARRQFAFREDNLSVFAATTSLQLLGVISDETGTGLLTFATAPTFTTNITAPLVIGGTATTSTLILRSTSGVGADGADMIFQVGNNGTTEAMRIFNNGNVGIGTVSPTFLLDIQASQSKVQLKSTSAITEAFINITNNSEVYGLYFGKNNSTGNSLLTGGLPYGGVINMVNANPFQIATTNVPRITVLSGGNVGIGTDTPTAILHLKAGTATASTAPLKFTTGTNLTTAEAGAIEFTTDDLFFTITTGAARKAFVLDDGARLTSGKIPIATTNGRLIDGQTPLAGTKVYYVSDTSGGAVTRKLTFTSGVLTAEV